MSAPVGLLVVDEVLEFHVDSVRLHRGTFELHTSRRGPTPELPLAEHQVVIYGADGIEVAHSRVAFAIPGPTDAEHSTSLVLPICIDEARGTSPW